MRDLKGARFITKDGEVTEVSCGDAADFLEAKRGAGEIQEFTVTLENGYAVTVHKDTHPTEFGMLLDAVVAMARGEP